jgi:hypothetical protein
MGTNLQKTWEKKFLNKEDIWASICKEFEKEVSWQVQHTSYKFFQARSIIGRRTTYFLIY